MNDDFENVSDCFTTSVLPGLYLGSFSHALLPRMPCPMRHSLHFTVFFIRSSFVARVHA